MTAQSQGPFFQTVYISSARELMDDSSLDKMLADIRVKNAALGVTGILLYVDGNIMQVLEGEQALIDELMQKITIDPRHKGVIVLLREAIHERQFGDWSMAYRSLSNEEAEGFSNFFNKSSSKDEELLQASRVKSLLVRFRDSMT